MNGMGEAPGKVWFFELAAAVIDADRCMQCGACIAACPTDSLGVELRRPALPREDVHRLLALLGLLPPRRAALRGDLADRVRRTEVAARRRAERDDRRRARRIGALGVGIRGGRRRVRPPRAAYARPPVAPRTAVSSPPCSSPPSRPARSTARSSHGRTRRRRGGRAASRHDPRGAARDAAAASTTRRWRSPTSTSTVSVSADDARIAIVGTPCEIQGIRALQARQLADGRSRIEAVDALDRPALHEELRLPQADARASCATSAGSTSPRSARSTSSTAACSSGTTRRGARRRAGEGIPRRGAEGLRRVRRLPRARGGHLGRQRRQRRWLLERPRAHRRPARRRWRSSPADLEISAIDRPEALEKLDQLDKRIALAPPSSAGSTPTARSSSTSRSTSPSTRAPSGRRSGATVEPTRRAADAGAAGGAARARRPLRRAANALRRRSGAGTPAHRARRRLGLLGSLAGRASSRRGELQRPPARHERLRGREVWLWVAGERTWSQMADGLAGRIARRLRVSRASSP